jgi:ferric-dicitrate binding protein FerR (iron transport regulator)
MTRRRQTIESLLSDESFQRWISGQASQEEQERWTHWLNERTENRQQYEKAVELWHAAQYRPTTIPDMEQEWSRLQRRLRLTPDQPGKILKLPGPDTAPHHPRHARAGWFRYAALAAAAVLLVTLVWHSTGMQPEDLAKPTYQEVSTVYGQRARITLPDQTIIVLNAHSTLRYPAVWSENTPRLFELEGEAFFDVAPRPAGIQQSFTVRTRDGQVRVVGTRFVVYDRGEGTRVAVEEGKVEVVASDTSDLSASPAARVLLDPGSLVRFQKGDRALLPRKVDIRPYTTWRLGQLVLHETPFAEIVRRLEETYGVEVEVKDERLLRRTLSGSVENQNLAIITEALSRALQVPVKRQGHIVIFGNSSK